MDVFVVVLVIASAAAYAAVKAWRLFRPGPKSGGCHCSSAGSGCSGCPLVSNKD